MKKKISLIITIMFFSVFSYSQLKIEPEIFEFKQVKSGTIVKALYRIKNIGKVEIKIKRISTSCGCTTVSKKPDKLSPGEIFNLEVDFNTRGLADQVIKTIYIETDFKKEKRNILKIKGKIIPEPTGKLEFEKRRIDFGIVSKGKQVIKKIKVTNTGQKELEITQISLPPFFRITLDKIKLNPGESTYLHIESLPTIYGQGMKTISLLTNALYTRYQWLQVSYEVK
jgi:hypothetical protein